MKKLVGIFLTALLFFTLPSVIFAKSNQQGNAVQQKTQDPITQEGVTTTSMGKSDTTRQNLSIVDQKVEKLLSNEEGQTAIGQEIKQIAQSQKQAQNEIEGQLDELESRNSLMKKLFGADRKAIRNLKRQMEQNQLRIKQMEQLRAKVVNQADQVQIQEATQALVEQNTALADQVQAEENVKGVFGWLLKFLLPDQKE